MNEELTLAIDELRQRSADQTWFIPVLLSECEIPNRTVGGGETLRSFQHVALYQGWDEGLTRILSTLQADVAIVHSLEQQLKEKSARRRISASENLAVMGGQAKRVVPTLIMTLKDENVTVQRVAIHALAKIGGPTEEVVAALLEHSDYSDWFSKDRDERRAKRAAREALQAFGAAAIAPMIDLADKYPRYLHPASEILSSILDINSLDELEGLLTHESPRIRGCAALAIGNNTADEKRGQPGDVDTSDVFEKQFQTVSPSASVKNGLVCALGDTSAFVRSMAALAIGQMGPPAADLKSYLVRALNDSVSEVRARAAYALGELGDAPVDAIPMLIGMLPSREATFALGRMGEQARGAVPVMLDHLRTATAFEAPAIIVALGRIGDIRAVPILLRLLTGPAEPEVLAAAASGLSYYPETEDITRPLENIIDNQKMSRHLRFSAATTLGRYDPSKGVPLLVSYLRNGNLAERGDAADALGRIGSGASGAVQALIDALRDGERAEFYVLRALKRIGTPQALEAVQGFDIKRLNSED